MSRCTLALALAAALCGFIAAPALAQNTPTKLRPKTSESASTVTVVVTNARNHAPGKATEVHLRYDPDTVRLTVTNELAEADARGRQARRRQWRCDGGHGVADASTTSESDTTRPSDITTCRPIAPATSTPAR